MTPAGFRGIALAMPEAFEASHMGHPDFRVRRGKIFATLGYPDASWGVVLLTPEEQGLYVEMEPEAFEPVPGGWGRGGSTRVRLKAVDAVTLRGAMMAAWRKAAPKALAAGDPSTTRNSGTRKASTKGPVRRTRLQSPKMRARKTNARKPSRHRDG
jgi:hypothetical protein